MFDVFVNCAFNVPWAIFDAQAQYLVHPGLPRRCVFHMFNVFVNCAFNVPWAIFDAQAQYLVEYLHFVHEQRLT